MWHYFYWQNLTQIILSLNLCLLNNSQTISPFWTFSDFLRLNPFPFLVDSYPLLKSTSDRPRKTPLTPPPLLRSVKSQWDVTPFPRSETVWTWSVRERSGPHPHIDGSKENLFASVVDFVHKSLPMSVVDYRGFENLDLFSVSPIISLGPTCGHCRGYRRIWMCLVRHIPW